MAQTEGAQTEGADGSRSCRTHPGVARRMGGMDDGATLDDARRGLAHIGRERGKTTVIATVTRLVRRIIGAVEVFGGEDAGGEEVGARARDVSGERRGLGGARGKEDDGARDDGEGAQGEGGDDVRRGLGGRDAREVSRSIGRRARGVAARRLTRARGARTSRDSVDARTHRHRVRARARRELDVGQRGAPRGDDRRADGACVRRDARARNGQSRVWRHARAFALSSARARVALPRRADTAHRNTALESSRSLASPARACGRASRSAREISFPFDSSPVDESARRAERPSRLAAVVVARDRRGG